MTCSLASGGSLRLAPLRFVEDDVGLLLWLLCGRLSAPRGEATAAADEEEGEDEEIVVDSRGEEDLNCGTGDVRGEVVGETGVVASEGDDLNNGDDGDEAELEEGLSAERLVWSGALSGASGPTADELRDEGTLGPCARTTEMTSRAFPL